MVAGCRDLDYSSEAAKPSVHNIAHVNRQYAMLTPKKCNSAVELSKQGYGCLMPFEDTRVKLPAPTALDLVDRRASDMRGDIRQYRLVGNGAES